MKRANRLWLMSVCMVGCLLGAAHRFNIRHVYAQQSTRDYSDGTFYILASVNVDSSYNLYVDSSMDVEFDSYEDIDSIEVTGSADEDGEYLGGGSNDGDDYTSAEVSLRSNNPVATGHEYGMASDGYACYDDGEGNGNCEYVGSAYASVYVQSPPPRIYSITPSSVHQGDQGTLTLTGADFIENSGDQLTLNFHGGANPFTLTSAPSLCTSSCTATFSYDFTGYPPGTYTLSLSNNEAESDYSSFTVLPAQPVILPPSDPCAVTSSPQVGFSSIVSTGTTGGTGTMAVSFSGSAYAAVSPSVTYGPYSTPSSIAANIAALISRTYYRYGLGARAFGPIVVYSGNTPLGAVSNVASGSSFTTDASSAAGAQAANACHNAPAPTAGYAVAYSAYIPVDHVYGPDQCTYPAPGGQNISVQLLYNGNGFRNSYKVTQAISLNFAASTASGYFADTGLTTNYGFGSPYNGQSAPLSPMDNDSVYFDTRTNHGTPDCYLRNKVGKADPSSWTYSTTVNPSAADTTMHGESQNPLSLPFGSIKWTMDTVTNLTNGTGYVNYLHTCYPAHQVRAANTTLYLYTPQSDSTFYIVGCLTGLRSMINGTSPTKTIR